MRIRITIGSLKRFVEQIGSYKGITDFVIENGPMAHFDEIAIINNHNQSYLRYTHDVLILSLNRKPTGKKNGKKHYVLNPLAPSVADKLAGVFCRPGFSLAPPRRLVYVMA